MGDGTLEQASDARSLYARIPGGLELLAWFGDVPDFHDAEVIEVSLHRNSASLLRLHAWDQSEAGDQSAKHAVVTLRLEGILDLQLDGFSPQNVIYALVIRSAPERADRRPHYWDAPGLDDIEIELEPCYGLAGLIRCRKLSIELTPGRPSDATV
jgi:hypothetical protein